MRSLAEDLRSRTDEELVTLLLARPDLARPAPTDLGALAARATTRASLRRALESLDLAHLRVLEAVVVAAPAPVTTVATLLDVPEKLAEELTATLWTRGLCWASPEGLRVPRPLADLIGAPAGLGPASPGGPGSPTASDETLRAEIDALDPAARSLLEALAWGPPRGSRPAADSPVAATVRDLEGRGLLLPGERPEEVVLPREVALVLRGGRLHRERRMTPPEPASGSAPSPEAVDATAGGRAGELLTLVAEIVSLWGDHPPRVLRSGGLAVRDLVRLATHLEIAEDEAAWLLETVQAAGLIGIDEEDEACWAPTDAADRWSTAPAPERWAALASAWWGMAADPGLVGPGRDGTSRINALSLATSDPQARTRRQDTLAALATLAGTPAPGEEDLAALVRWRRPLRPAGPVAPTLREATWAGVVALGALSSPGRALVTGQDPEQVAAAMEPHVPAPVDHVLLQADLTAIAPGRLEGPVRTLMHLLTEVESRGGATVHRFSESGIRRALDRGATADRLLGDLAAASPTGVPQPLEYLIRDVARRHGQIRVGACAAYVRSEDPALLDRLERDRELGPLQWRRPAPTVLVTPVPGPTVVDLLREHGYGPALDGDGAGGGLLLRPPPARRATVTRAPVRTSPVDAEVAGAVVGLMRRGEGARSAGLDDAAERDPVAVAATLRDAVGTGTALWIGYADEIGGVSTHLVRPRRIDGGRLRATVGEGDRERSFSLHRVTAVRPAD